MIISSTPGPDMQFGHAMAYEQISPSNNEYQVAALSSQRVNDYRALSKTIKNATRSYLTPDDLNRSLDMRNRNQTLMLEPSYKRVRNDNLWNEKHALSPRW